VVALLDHERGRLRPGLVIVADKGFAGRDFAQLVSVYGASLLRPDRADEPPRQGSLGRVRQWIESTFDSLKDQLGPERHGGRTLAGVWVRVAQRLLALTASIWWNWGDRRTRQALPGRLRPLTHHPIRSNHLAARASAARSIHPGPGVRPAPGNPPPADLERHLVTISPAYIPSDVAYSVSTEPGAMDSVRR
jgi:hypothetical protein